MPLHDPSDVHRRHATPEAAQATVEFAIILPILCLILFAVVEFGMAFWSYQQVSAAASEGARKAAVSRTYGNRNDLVTQAVRDASPELDEGGLSVTTSSSWVAGDPVTVAVSYPEDISVLGISFFDSNLTVRRTSRVEQ